MAVLDLPETHARQTYDSFAALYDSYTWDHDYELWVPTLEGVLGRHGHRGRRLLDVACGTGKSLLPWLDRGYDAVGCDLSPTMVVRAAEKIDGRARLEVADMRLLPETSPRDLVTCLGDSVNYLLHPGDLVAAFQSVAERLRPGGLYLFDLNALWTYRNDFAQTRRFRRDGWDFVWTGHGDGRTASGALVSATIRARRAGSRRRPSLASRHEQRHHPIPRVRAGLRAAGLAPVQVYGQHRDGSLDPHFAELCHSKALVVARKA
jgi:SAM-dependent methyltransferase